jgi:uncharacterized membrane protein YbhN (UPF0104 family)
MKLKDAAKFVAGLAVAILLLWWVLRDPSGEITWAEVWQTMKQASPVGLLLAVLLNLGHVVPRAWRWGTLLRPVRAGIRLRPMFSSTVIGYMTSWIVPGRVGELVRPALLSAREKLPLGPCMGSIVADRLLDGVTIVAMFAVGVFLTPYDEAIAEGVGLFKTAALAMLAGVGIGIGMLLLFSIFREPIEAWLDGRPKLIAWVGRSFLSLARGVDALREWRRIPLLLLQSAVIWLVIALSTWVGVRACGVDIPFAAVLMLNPLLALGVAVPTPGNAYHSAMKLGLGWFGVQAPFDGSAAILMWLVITVPPIVLGTLLLKVEGISWRHLLEIGRQLRSLGSAPAAAQHADEPAEEPS